MDRHAIFVDVGYVIASMAEMLTSSPDRSLVTCAHGSLLSADRRVLGAFVVGAITEYVEQSRG